MLWMNVNLSVVCSKLRTGLTFELMQLIGQIVIGQIVTWFEPVNSKRVNGLKLGQLI